MQLPKRYVPTGKKFSTGGMSEAIVCKDTHLDRLVIVKSLSPGVDQKRILDELSALQTIRSKHVVQIFDVIRDKAGHVVAIVEEYLSGDDLTGVKIPTNSLKLLRLIYPIAKGIADVHAHKRVHRDIKRENMRYDGEGCLKIFDFGLARDSSATASTIGFVGTVGYMAPELFKASASGKVVFTDAVDVFAFGATILAIARGDVPPDFKHMPPKLPCKEADFSKLPQILSADVASILNQCLDPDASQRPKMSEVTRVLGLHLSRDQHRALLVSAGKIYFLDKNNRVVHLAVTGKGALTITYDGLRFVLSDVSGYVAVNNMPLKDGDDLPGSCVIVLGSSASGARTIITVDVSHPEVTL